METSEAFIEVIRYGSNHHDVAPQVVADHLNAKGLYFSENDITVFTTPF